MSTPGFNLVLFVALVVIAVLLFWPGFGVLPRVLRQRLTATRVRLEDALKHIYHQQSAGQTATVVSLGGALEASPTTAVALVQRMQQAGLARFTDGRIVLTAEGERYALQVIRAHRLWERYLADETGVDPLRWHASADRREHRMTPREADALAERLGDPRFDPHGDPIPTADGQVPELDARVTPLSELAEGDRAHVMHVEDEPQVVYEEIVARGIHPGQEVVVRSTDDRRTVFDADGREITLSPLVAANVSVRPARKPSKDRPPAPSRTLADLEIGQEAEVVRISPACRGIERRRLMDLGIVPGTAISRERRSMSGGLSAYRVRGTLIALRREQADTIAVEIDDRKAS